MTQTLPDTRRCLLVTCPQGHPWSNHSEGTELHDPAHENDPHDLLRGCAELGLMISLGFQAQLLPSLEAGRRFRTYTMTHKQTCPDCQRLTDAHHRLTATLESALTGTPVISEVVPPADPPLDSELLDLLCRLAGAHPAYDLGDLRRALEARGL